MSRFLILLLLAAFPSSALHPSRKLWHYIQSHWQDRDGLPQNTILAIAQSADGYLWFGTEAGLARFNGRTFLTFDRTNTPAFLANGVTALAASSSGTLWVGTRKGLLRCSNGRFERLPAGQPIATEHIRFLSLDPSGDLWIGAASGVARLSGDDLSYPFSPIPDSSPDRIRSFWKRGEAAWIGTTRGLARFHAFQFSDVASEIPFDTVRAVLADKQNHFWIGTENRGLFEIDGRSIRRYTTRDGLGSDSVRTLLEDRDGNLWIGTIGGGLTRRSHSKFETLSTADGLPSNHVRSLFEDAEGSLWVGLEAGGLVQLRDGRLLTLTRRDGLASEFIRAIHGDPAAALFIGTEGEGLFRYHNGLISRVAALGLPKAFITSLHLDRQGQLWVGTEGNGAFCLSATGRRHYSTATGISEDSAWAIHQDPSGAIWIGTSNGLLRLHNGTRTVFTTAEGLKSNGIRALFATRDGTLWIAFNGGGMQRIRGGSIGSLALPDLTVNSMHQDAAGTLWMATNNGLLQWNGDSPFHFTSRHGLFSDVLFQVLEDGQQRLWFGSSKGIFAVSKQQLEQVRSGAAAKAAAISFTTADGMKSSECSTDAQPAGWRSADGSLWFSTIRGVIRIHPGELSSAASPPPVLIENVSVNGAGVPSLQRIVSPPGNRLLSVQFAALSFASPASVRFRYRLDGVDQDWVESTGDPAATYHNLPPGNFRFAVIAANGDGPWSAAPATLDLEVQPFFTQTWMFYALCAIVFAAAAFSAYTIRSRALQVGFAAVLAERTRIAREIHDTLLQGFAGAALQLNAISRKLLANPEASRAALDSVLDQIETCLAEARSEIVHLRSPSSSEPPFIERIQHTVHAAAGSGLSVQFDVDGTPTPLSPLIERNLIRIAGEAIANAIQHARAGSIHVRVEFSPGAVRLHVRDDGVGMASPAPSPDHFGLSGMRERTQLLGGEFSIDSASGRGTAIAVRIPWKGLPG